MTITSLVQTVANTGHWLCRRPGKSKSKQQWFDSLCWINSNRLAYESIIPSYTTYVLTWLLYTASGHATPDSTTQQLKTTW